MKKFLYEIVNNGLSDRGIPPMPKVLAEKTAKDINKRIVRIYGNMCSDKYYAQKTNIHTRDASPRGYTSWYDFIFKIRAEEF